MANLDSLTINDTGYLGLASGTTSQRPASPSDGYMRYNTDLDLIEVFYSSDWVDIATGNIVTGIVTDGLVLYLDAGNSSSYPGSGTTWTDLSGNGYNFTINANAYTTSGGISYMSFINDTNGGAKRVVGGSLSDVPNYQNGTFMVFSTILNSTSTWRTLVRGAAGDHAAIIESGTNNLGMYDNATGFYDSGFDITSLPSPYTQFNCLIWKPSQSSPYYSFQYNDNSTTYTITNANATFDVGFASIGCFHDNSTIPTSSSQYWGNISVFLYYNKHLSSSEIQQNYNYFKGRFGL